MKKIFFTSLLVAAMVSLASSCARDALTPASDEDTTLIRLSGIASYTKSVLPDDIDDLVTEVKIAAYDQFGYLEASGYYETDGSESMEMTLNANNSHTVYALVNMGDIGVPIDEKELEELEYEIESYEQMSGDGLPMAGSADMAAGDTECEISVRRLVAKLALTMVSGDVTPDKISEVRLCNWNHLLTPFASEGGKAEDADDVSSGEEGQWEELSGWDGTELVFYVPENMQGTLLSGNTDPTLKTYSSLSEAQAALCTYLEVDVSVDENTTGVWGDLTYRFYLGSNTTDNFDVEGNTLYSLSFSLTWNGQFYEDEWMVDNDDLTDSRSLSLASLSVTPLSDGYEVDTLDTGTLLSRCETAVYVSLKAGGEEIGDESYSRSYGWCVPDTCLSRLEGLGISCEVEKATLVYDTEALLPLYIRSGDDVPSGCEDVGQGERLCVLLGMDSYDYSRASVPLTVQTIDGQHSASIDISLRPHLDPTVSLDGDSTGHYIAQRHKLSISDLSKVTFLGFVVENEDDKVVSLTSTGSIMDLNWYVDMLKGGTGYISMNYTYSIDGTSISGSQTIKKIEVKTPSLCFEKDEVTISTSGGKQIVSLAYYDEDGSQMVCSGTSLETSGYVEDSSEEYPDEPTEFYRPLFEDILSPVVTVKNFSDKNYLYQIGDDVDDIDDCSLNTDQVGVLCTAEAEGVVYCYIKTGGGTIIQDEHELGYVLANAVNCNDIQQACLTVWIADES